MIVTSTFELRIDTKALKSEKQNISNNNTPGVVKILDDIQDQLAEEFGKQVM